MVVTAVDRKILNQLLKNSEQSILEIAEKVGSTRQTVAKRIEWLKKQNTLKSFTVILKPEDLDLKLKAFIFLKEDPNDRLRTSNAEQIVAIPQISQYHRIFGSRDSVIELLTKDHNELTKIVKKLHKLNGVKSTETFIVHTTLKYMPESPFIEGPSAKPES